MRRVSARTGAGSSPHLTTTPQVWDAESGKPVGKPMRHRRASEAASFSPDGRRVVTASQDKYRAGVGCRERRARWASLCAIEDSVEAVSFSPDGRWVVTGSGDQTAQVWDADSGKPVGEPMRHGGRVVAASFSPDGRRIVTASNDKTARVWDAEERQAGRRANAP